MIEIKKNIEINEFLYNIIIIKHTLLFQTMVHMDKKIYICIIKYRLKVSINK